MESFCNRTNRPCIGGAYDGSDGLGIDCDAGSPENCPYNKENGQTSEKYQVIFQNRQGKFRIFEKKLAREAASTLIELNEAGLWGFIIEYNSGRVIARTAEEGK